MVSVCMATYNGEKYIKEQIDSILSEIKENDEIVISDDNSTDCTVEIIKSYNDDRIKLYHSNARNFKKNFENARNKAKGDIIFLSDQDDVWIFVKSLMHCLKRSSGSHLDLNDRYTVSGGSSRSDSNKEVPNLFFAFSYAAAPK